MAANRPNMVFVFPDQMRGTAMGFLGIEPVHTPNLDGFASQGLVLTEAASSYPVCSPFRAMFMSGQYPHQNGVTGNCNHRHTPYGVELSDDTRCWSDLLHDTGYRLGYIGKWHLDAPRPPYIDCANNRGDLKWNEWCPPERRHGFDFWYAYGTYDDHTRPMYWRGDAERDGFHYVDQWGPEHEADLAVRYIHNEGQAYRDADKPFALVVSMNPPHTPYRKHPDRYCQPYTNKNVEELCTRPDIPPAGTRWGDHYRKHIRDYYASITGVDEQFGRILQAIDDAGRREDTLVIFMSDHGDCLGIHNHATKSIWWEASMHVPFIARFPGRLPQGQTDDLLINAPDLYPTILGLLGLADQVPEQVTGFDYSQALINGGGPRPTSQLYQWLTPKRPESGLRGIRSHRWKLSISGANLQSDDFIFPNLPEYAHRVHLYDREADPYELNNLAEQRPDVVKELLQSELHLWLERAGDPFRPDEVGTVG